MSSAIITPARGATRLRWLRNTLRVNSAVACAFGRRIRDAMLGAKRVMWLCHMSDLQQRSAPEAGESNVQDIAELTHHLIWVVPA